MVKGKLDMEMRVGVDNSATYPDLHGLRLTCQPRPRADLSDECVSMG
jgi:hypothetical protein